MGHLPHRLTDGAPTQLGRELVTDGLLPLVPAPTSHFCKPSNLVQWPLWETPAFLGESPLQIFKSREAVI